MNVAEKPPVANAEIRIPTRTCPGCGEAVPDAEVRANACVCPRCKHYFPMPAPSLSVPALPKKPRHGNRTWPEPWILS